MNKAILNRNLRKLHLWFGIGIGLQIGLWLISGLFMTLFPIDQVRGTHLRTELIPPSIGSELEIIGPVELVSMNAIEAQSVTLKFIDGEPVYVSQRDDETRVFDAKSGKARAPLTQTLATKIALANYAGRSTQTNATFFEVKAPREYGREGPVWRIDFEKPDAASFYVDASTAEVRAVRTGLWRTFDFMWGLHIMDWSNRENFNSWWIKMTASLAVIFFLIGVCLAVLRISSMLGRRQKISKQSGGLSQ